MKDEELMDALGEVARDRDFDLRWEKLAAGELNDEELAELRADVGGEAAVLEAAFAPLDESDHADFASAILDAEAQPTPITRLDARPSRMPASPSARRRHISRRAFLVGVPGIALAAAIALAIWVPRSDPTLPVYTASVHGGARTQRGGNTTDGRFRADDRVELRLRPSTETTVPVHAALFRARGDGVSERVSQPIEVASSGAVRISARASELLPEPGDYTVTIIVAPSRTPIDSIDVEPAIRVRFRLVRDDRP